MKKLKKLFINNTVSTLIALFSVISAIVFCVYIYKLDMLPSKYLIIAFILIIVVYLIAISLLFFCSKSKIVKVICCIFFIVNSFISCCGIYFSDKTIETLDRICYHLSEKEDYELKVSNKSNISSKDDINGKKIGIFKNEKYDDVVKYLKKDVECELIDYDDPVKFFEDLSKGKIDGIIASNMVYTLLEEDLSYMNLEIKTIHVVEVPFENKSDKNTKEVDVTNTTFNIFIAGGDRRGSIDQHMNTDVNMIVSVDPVNRKLLLTSIPRDYYVHLASRDEGVYDKLTHAGYYGVEESVKTVEELMGIDINYYVKINFTTVQKIVDAIGGVDVNNPRAFTFKYHYKKGLIHLNGDEALHFSRGRKMFSDGDVTRVQNQQLVITAIIKKIMSSKTTLLKYSNILEIVSENLATNMDRSSISQLVKMQISDMRSWEIASQHLNGTPSATYGCFSIPKYYLYIMRQDKNSIKKAKDNIDAFFENGNTLKK